MSVLIRGLKKPKSCIRMTEEGGGSCPFLDNEEENCQFQKEEVRETYKEMYEHCPLEEVREEPVKSDNVEHPSHYCTSGIECIDAMIAVFGVEAVKIYCKVNAFKYLWRTDRKNGREDLEKAAWYLKKYLELEDNEK